MLRFLLIMLFPVLTLAVYAVFLLCTTAPISVLSIEKAGQFGDSFGVVTSLFSGLAFSGALITLYLQYEAIKNGERQHAQNTRLSALAALLSVYHQLANDKQSELDNKQNIPMESGTISDRLEGELQEIRRMRDRIFQELEKAAGLK